ncbi:hypothetical protein ACLOJK_035083 [Asimina triloba]
MGRWSSSTEAGERDAGEASGGVSSFRDWLDLMDLMKGVDLANGVLSGNVELLGMFRRPDDDREENACRRCYCDRRFENGTKSAAMGVSSSATEEMSPSSLAAAVDAVVRPDWILDELDVVDMMNDMDFSMGVCVMDEFAGDDDDDGRHCQDGEGVVVYTSWSTGSGWDRDCCRFEWVRYIDRTPS